MIYIIRWYKTNKLFNYKLVVRFHINDYNNLFELKKSKNRYFITRTFLIVGFYPLIDTNYNTYGCIYNVLSKKTDSG